MAVVRLEGVVKTYDDGTTEHGRTVVSVIVP